ncbi:MAG TPA: Ig-like domain-containing protein [Gemmatimonadaceae bacterium]|jgi:hypothetical protein
MAPIAPGNARLSLSPRFATVAGAPSVPLTRIQGILVGPTGERTVQTATFANGSASLKFNVVVLGDSARFTLDLVSFDVNETEAYRAHNAYTLRPGDNDDLTQPVLEYSAPDSKVTALHFDASTITLDPGATIKIAATGTGANNAAISPLRLGWTSRNPVFATVDDAGNVVASQVRGQTYIVARTPANVADSVLVTTRGAVSQIVATPTSISMFRGATTTVSAEIRDPAGTVIADRKPTFTSADQKIATVNVDGVVTGVGVGATTVTAAVGDKIAPIAVTVASPVAGIQLAPATVALATIGATQQLTATILPQTGASTVGTTPTFATSDATVATVGADGRVTAIGYGVATITATIESFSATTAVTVVGPLVLAPATPTIFTNTTQQFSVTAGGKGPFTYTVNDVTGGNATLGTISATGAYKAPAGVPTPASVDVCAIQAAPSTKGCAKVTIASSVAGIQLAPRADTLATIGAVQQLTATITSKPGGSVVGLTPTFTTSDGAVATVSATGQVTAIGWGVATITAKIESFTATTSVTVVGPLVVSPGTSNKLPNGTQQFTVLAGGNGPFTWTVNGIAGGNATFGTIDVKGFYNAPAATPTPASFEICAIQASPATKGCTTMTINVVPPPGADVIVFNDVNIFNSPVNSATFADSANNRQLFRNIVGYTAPGIRATKTKVAMYFGHHSLLDSTVFANDAHFDTFKKELTQVGFGIDSLRTDLVAPLDPAYKVIMLFLPTTAFSNAEINNLKQFSADGGRIVFVGEWVPLYTGQQTENDFLSAMGAKMTNIGGAFDNGGVNIPATSLRQHQITTGMTGLWVAAASEVGPGPNDFAIIYDHTNTHVLVAAARVDVTPLPLSIVINPARANRQPLTATTVTRVQGSLAGGPTNQP